MEVELSLPDLEGPLGCFDRHALTLGSTTHMSQGVDRSCFGDCNNVLCGERYESTCSGCQ